MIQQTIKQVAVPLVVLLLLLQAPSSCGVSCAADVRLHRLAGIGEKLRTEGGSRGRVSDMRGGGGGQSLT